MYSLFSLGLIILEIIANIILPEYGDSWQKLRNNDFSEVDLGHSSSVLVDIVKKLLRRNPEERLTAKQILENTCLNQVMNGEQPIRHLDEDVNMS
jgi:mitosis inhibitor protein kinase SWE1